MRNPKDPPIRAAVFLFSSAGELDVVLPALQVDRVRDFRIVVFTADIRRRIASDGFYSLSIGNRLDDRSRAAYSEVKVVRWFQFLRSAIAVAIKYFAFDQFYFEYGNAGREKNILIPLLALLGRARRIRFHPHGHAVTDDNAYIESSRPGMIRFSTRLGSQIVKLNGVAPTEEFLPVVYPILDPEWRRYVSEHAPQLYSDHVVILSRGAHPAYLLEANRVQMFYDVMQIFEELFPDSQVVVKAHPREQVDPDVLGATNCNVKVSYDNTYSVVRGARFAVSFWTSAFFQCIALGVPVVEYHIPHQAFRDLYPGGSLNTAFVPAFEKKQQLRDYVKNFAGRHLRNE